MRRPPMLRFRLAVLAAALLWSTAGAAIKLSSLSAWQLSSGRSLVAAAILFLAFPRGRRLPSRRALGAACAYAATVTLFVIANKLTTSANAIFLQDTAPLWVLLLSPFLLGERARRDELWAVPIFLVGLGLFFVDRLAPGQALGNAVALLSGVAFAGTIMGLRAVSEEGPAVLVAGNVIAGLVSLPRAFFGPEPTATDVGLVAFLGVFQLGLAYTLFQYGLRKTPAIEASLLILIEPVLNPVWTWLLAGEVPGRFALWGGAIILAGCVWRTVAAARTPRAGVPA